MWQGQLKLDNRTQRVEGSYGWTQGVSEPKIYYNKTHINSTICSRTSHLRSNISDAFICSQFKNKVRELEKCDENLSWNQIYDYNLSVCKDVCTRSVLLQIFITPLKHSQNSHLMHPKHSSFRRMSGNIVLKTLANCFQQRKMNLKKSLETVVFWIDWGSFSPCSFIQKFQRAVHHEQPLSTCPCTNINQTFWETTGMKNKAPIFFTFVTNLVCFMSFWRFQKT